MSDQNTVDQTMIAMGLCPECGNKFEVLFGIQTGWEGHPGCYISHCGCIWVDRDFENHDPRPREEHKLAL